MSNLTTNKLDHLLETSRNEKRGMKVVVVVNGSVRLPVQEGSVVTNLETNELELRVDTGVSLAEPSISVVSEEKELDPQAKVSKAIELTNFGAKARLIRKGGAIYQDAMPIPLGTPDRIVVDTMKFELQAETSEGVRVYREVE